MSLDAWLVRNVTYPAHEWLRGRRTLHELAALRDLAAMRPDHVRQDEQRRLRSLLSFAGAVLPYYMELFARHGVDPRADDTEAELCKLPVQTKADVRAHADGVVWRDVPGGPVPHSSGGTTGDTLRFFIDRTRQAQDLAARLFMQSLFGVQPGDRRVHLWGSPIESQGARLKHWRNRLLNERLLNAFELSDGQVDCHLAAIRRFQPRVIYGYPTALARLARRAVASHSPEASIWLKLVVLTGEEVTGDHVAQVRQAFDCAVAAEYGNREVGLIAHECPQGGLHVVSPHIHLDVATNGQTLAAGRCGDVIGTTLNTRAQPFIRYRVGDIGRLEAKACPCGLPFPLLRLEGGKITGFIALPDGRLCHGAITSHILRGESGIVAYKTHQHTLDEFEVLLVVDDQFDAGTTERIRQRYRRLFGPRINVTCRIVESIPPDPSGKRRYVVSDVAPSYTNFEVVATPSAAGAE